MRVFLFLLTAAIASPASSQDGAIRGQMICEVIGSRLVAARSVHLSSSTVGGEEMPAGAVLVLDYALDGTSGISISLTEIDLAGVLVKETFDTGAFNGVSRISNTAEFRAAYSEFSIGRLRINYKGSDQLYLKRCGDDFWAGHFVRTNVGGLHTRVATLNCLPNFDAIDGLLSRLATGR